MIPIAACSSTSGAVAWFSRSAANASSNHSRYDLSVSA